MKWRGGGEKKKNKIKSKGAAKLCQGWAAAKLSLCSSSASQQRPGQPPAHLGRVRPLRAPAWSKGPPPAEGCARVCVCVRVRV